MTEISKITLPSGSVYDIKDTQARADIAAIQTAIADETTLRVILGTAGSL